MTVPAAKARTQIQFPTWNALYQIRDFVRAVQGLDADCDGQSFALERLDLNTWASGERTCSNLQIGYSVYANEEGVFSSALNDQHAYLNLAMILFYLPHERQRPVRVRFLVPENWKLASPLEEADAPSEFFAENYDALVDSPVEASAFQEYVYIQKGAQYRVIVHASPDDFPAERLLDSVKKITNAATELMQDVPFKQYTFLLHFPRVGGGGLEHRNGTAINVARDDLKSNWLGLESVLAHEFFHAWNVKRIRPQNLEPVDYVRVNDTRDLWFAEGVTSTIQEYILLRAGLISRTTFYERLANATKQLQDRPARLTQSLEDAGREAWLEKYPDYLRAERSISYYNKGMLVGFLLDLAMREASRSQHGLDDLLRRLNSDFAQRNRFFARDDLIQIVESLAPAGGGFRRFFDDYISGTHELDYDKYLGYAGLHLVKNTTQTPAVGFAAVQNFDQPVTVATVEATSNAQKAGLKAGDILLKMDGETLRSVPDSLLSRKRAGQVVRFRVRRGDREFALKYTLESKGHTIYRVEEDSHATTQQRRLREHWLKGVTVQAATAGKS